MQLKTEISIGFVVLYAIFTTWMMATLNIDLKKERSNSSYYASQFQSAQDDINKLNNNISFLEYERQTIINECN